MTNGQFYKRRSTNFYRNLKRGSKPSKVARKTSRTNNPKFINPVPTSKSRTYDANLKRKSTKPIKKEHKFLFKHLRGPPKDIVVHKKRKPSLHKKIGGTILAGTASAIFQAAKNVGEFMPWGKRHKKYLRNFEWKNEF